MKSFPKVSILVAARNEEANIADLLRSFQQLTYPKEKFQILIGNDGSSDATEQIIEAFISTQNIDIQLIKTENKINNLQGKANVLAQLAAKAKGDFWLMTDADMEVPTNWVETIIQHFDGKTGIVIGLSLVKNRNWFEASQAIEWLFILYLMHRLGHYQIPSTGMGNNMAVSREAYHAVGGYEKIGFSIVEDYALYDAIIKKGFGFKHLFESAAMATTKPPQNYFEQRKRWISGAISSGSKLILPALFQSFLLPILLISSILHLKITLAIVFGQLLLNFILGIFIFPKIHQQSLLKYIPAYTFYMYIFWFLQLIYYVLPTRLVWKGRRY